MNESDHNLVFFAVVIIMLFRMLVWPILKAIGEGLSVRWARNKHKNHW